MRFYKQQVHDEILYKSMKQRKYINYNVKQYPLLLGKDKDGWALAYNLKVQTFLFGNNELGCCGLLKQIKDDNIYILNEYFSQSEAKQVFISSISPVFKVLQEKAVQGQQYETLLFQPQNIEEASLDFNNVNKQFVQMVTYSSADKSNKTSLGIQFKKDALRNFKVQLQQYANEISAKFLNELHDCLNSIIEKTDCEDIQQNFTTQIESKERSNFFDNTQKLNNQTEQCLKSEDNFVFIDSSNKIALNEDKLFSKNQDTLGQIQEETEQNSLCSPELNKRKVKIKQINLIKNEQLIKNGRRPNLFDSQHPINNVTSFTYQSQLKQGQSIGSLGALASQKYLSTNNLQNQALS
ncbi:hypothetical protein ABPG72_020620 [Tetrahymena utriculariae]